MGSAVGLQTSIGTAEEVTYGTVVTPNRWFEFLDESLERKNKILTSRGLRSGTRNLQRGSRRVLSARSGVGNLKMEVATTGFGRWFKHLLGGTPTVAQQGGTTAYLHIYSMGDLQGKSQTLQKVLRDSSGTEVEAFTFEGVKTLEGEFSISVDKILELALALDAEDVQTATATAAASYGTTSLFHFAQGTLKVGGSSVANVTDSSVKVVNPLNTDRYYLGSSGLKKEPVDNDFPSVTGSITAEFDNPATLYDRFVADSAAELILEFVGPTISGIYTQLLRITVPEVHFLGETPKVSGPQVIVSGVPFEGAFDGTNPGVKVEYQTTDTAV